MGDEDDWNSDSFLRAGGSIVLRKLFLKLKKILKVVGRLVLLLIVPLFLIVFYVFGTVAICVAAIYNSPFAVLLPKPTENITAFEYVDELYQQFDIKLSDELNDHKK